ncbi:General stress protein A [uncultured Roseburia sp.]|uniref:DUF4422 domain-containing protein n=1 Tax=Brotonthovivens ammoniilytica TaxID=2981725 RepID=A0ABT2TF61_9FIRM|nr:DUF4422 domain-containing protein [Brotonthovivens ammoniilytica]MCU6760828.1 DUF4422 domain-containing protein [Brotonthovivens ammoniilytica]SCI10577.1 General stress protein A [uncultured Roseburia sp.]
MKLSVIMPVYNVEKYLSESLDSVLGQTLKDIEIICINDGSTDHSGEILNTYAKAYPNIVLINETNHGVGFARNEGIRNAQGEFIAFMDPDDYYPENNILELLYTKAKGHQVLICGGSLCEDHNDGKWIRKTFDGLYQKYTFHREELIAYDDYQFDFGFYRFIYNRDFLIENEIFFPPYIRFQDPPFFVKAMILARQFYAVPDYTYCYRYGHQNLVWSEKRTADLIRGHIDILKLSAVNHLKNLHLLTLYRLCVISQKILDEGVKSKSRLIIKLLKQADAQVNPSWIQKEKKDRDIWKSLQSYFPDHKLKQDQKLKILLSYHKPDHLFKDTVLTPIHAGRTNAQNKLEPNDNALNWLMQNTIGDNSGNHISYKNDTYNEMTTVFWAWKNYEKLGNPDYIGFMHYRRHFLFNDQMERSVYEYDDIDDKYFETIQYSEYSIPHIMDDCDFITVKPQWRSSMYEHYKKNHDIADLDMAIEILKEKYPSYKEDADTYLSGPKAYFCNMFIFPKDLFFEYAEWFFSIVFELENRIDLTKKRLFVSEWLTGIFITHLIRTGKKGKFFPTMIVEGMHQLPVVMAADNNYALPMLVSCASILQHAKGNTHYQFYFLVPGDFSDKNKQYFEQLSKHYGKSSLYFINMEDSYKTEKLVISHITAATYYRLRLPGLLPDVKKCLYLDVDTIVKNDLSILYRTSVDDKYLAGVIAPGYLETEEKITSKKEELGITSLDTYINAGVLLMNLAKMRNDHLELVFEKLLKKKFSSQDQDILNAGCYGKIRVLPFKYNAMTKYALNSDYAYKNTQSLQRSMSEKEWNDGRKHPAIIHYADRKKPWNDLSVIYAEQWWDTVNKLPENMCADIYKHYWFKAIRSAQELNDLFKLTASHKRDLLGTKDQNLEKIKHLENSLKKKTQEYQAVRASKSFRLGRFLLAVPIRIKKLFKARKSG